MQMLIERRKAKKKSQFTLAADLAEIHQYVEDLGHMTILRDKCMDAEERSRYDNILKVMQLVLHRLNELGGTDGRLHNMEKLGIGTSPGRGQSQG
jgi:hypothetical protein